MMVDKRPPVADKKKGIAPVAKATTQSEKDEALSMAMSQSQVMQAANLAVLQKSMDAQTAQVANLVEMMSSAVPQAAPPSAHTLDITV